MAVKSLKDRVQCTAYQLVFLQLLGVLLISGVSTLIAGSRNGISMLLGGTAYVLTNLVFVWRVFRYVGARQMAQFMAAFFIGEMLKLILSAILVLLIVKYLEVSLLSVLIGLMTAIISFWAACIWSVPKQSH